MKGIFASTAELRTNTEIEEIVDYLFSNTAFSYKSTKARGECGVKYLLYTPTFCPKGVNPYSTVEWGKRDARILNGNTIAFEQKGVEAPITWSDSAVNIVAQKYFRGELGTESREHSVKQIIERVTERIKSWALTQSYFNGEDNDVTWWINDLKWLLLHQYASFNSPVWFNLGVPGEAQQTSACFCQSVQDSMESIAQLQVNESLIFKGGSGTGTNFSTLRSSKEKVRGGGTASGPVSFMRGYDSWAGIIRSGGKVRRSAKLAVLNIDHPDILEFINSKVEEEKKVKALIGAGYSANYNDEKGAYSSVHFQSTNHSVRLSDSFMEKLESQNEEIWKLKAVTDKDTTLEEVKVVDLWNALCKAAHHCGDPGVQFDTTINKWNTCKETERLNTSNPCGEYHGIDETSCNLASLNLCKFKYDNDEDFNRFGAAISIFIVAQDVIINMSNYPTPQIGVNTKDYRALGLGYTNLGAYLMSNWIPYDSEEGRKIAANVTSYLTAMSYLTSSILAQVKGPFKKYSNNRKSMLNVIEMHRQYARSADAFPDLWNTVYKQGEKHGFRNSQVTLLAPTGTISFMMDCDTTGVEPDLALSKIKILADGGVITIDNKIVEKGLQKSERFNTKQIEDILDYIRNSPSKVKEAPYLDEYDLKVLETAIGDNAISPYGHLDMLTCIQPFISGAISKTVNISESATPEDIGGIFQHAWRSGIKNITVYRNNSKNHQPLQVNGGSGINKKHECTCKNNKQLAWGTRKPIPDTRKSITKKFDIDGAEGYLTVGLHKDGTPGEIFIKGIEGTLLSGLLDSFAIATSLALQYGCPLEKLVNKLIGRSFEPQGWTPDLGHAKSIVDYIARWLKTKFLEQNAENQEVEYSLCRCGGQLIPGGGNGSCFTCSNCGDSNGSCG